MNGRQRAAEGEPVPAMVEAANNAASGIPRLMIEMHSLKKDYGFKPVLRRIDLVLPQGERMALIGSNGAGKTTLLRILAGLQKTTTGRVIIGGLDSEHHAQDIRRLVGFVAHQPYIYEELSALENLLFFGRLYNVAHVRERARNLLARVGLERRAHERASTFSRGQLQRLAWARALLHEPPLLLLDEPETGLDQQGITLMDALLTEHTAQGGSTFFTTHTLERAWQMSDHIVLLSGGRIVSQLERASVTLEELQRRYAEVLQ